MARAEFDSARIAVKKNQKHLMLCWKGTTKELCYCYFPVWEGGELRKVPVGKAEQGNGGWTAAGELKTDHGRWVVEDVLTPDGNTLIVDRTWRYEGDRIASVRVGFDLVIPFRKVDFWTIPYISMNGNAGSRTVPTGLAKNGTPWVFREERTTAPGLMTVESNGIVAGSYTDPGTSEDTLCACSLMREGVGHIARIFYPFYEAPFTFLGAAYPGRSSMQEQGLYTCATSARGMTIESGDVITRRFYVVLDRTEARRHGYIHVWESAWRNLGGELAPAIPVEKTEKLLWDSMDHFWLENGKARGFLTRVSRDGSKHEGFSPTLSTGWCCPQMMLAYLAIRKALNGGGTKQAERAVRAVNFFVEHARRDNGVFLSHYNARMRQWSEGGINAVQLGGGMYWQLRCLELLREKNAEIDGLDVKKWEKMALDFCDLAVRTQRRDGAFAAHWTVDGEVAGFERAMGSHSARAVLLAYVRTGDEKYLQSARRGVEFIIRNIIDREKDYGDCTDILNTTTENDAACVPDLLIDLYRITGEKRYLDKAVRSAEYCLSFTFAYNMYFPSETESGRRGMKTRGFGTISPETAFVCWMFSLQGNAFLDLWKETGDGKWKEYAVAVIRASMQMMTEPGDTFGLADHLVGIRAEVIPVSDTIKGGFIWKKGMTGYTWHQPVWWPAAYNLMNFAFVEDNYPEVKQDIES
jgi:hypothetical protein